MAEMARDSSVAISNLAAARLLGARGNSVEYRAKQAIRLNKETKETTEISRQQGHGLLISWDTISNQGEQSNWTTVALFVD